MKSRDITALKHYLSKSDRVESPDDLDHSVLTASRQAAEDSRHHHRFRYDGLVTRFSAISVAISITLGLFVLMQFAVQPKQAPFLADHSQDEIELRFAHPTPSIESILAKYTIERPLRDPIIIPPATQIERDTVLTALDLPDPHALFASLNKLGTETMFATRSDIADAFDAINISIGEGELDNARFRYQSFVAECRTCGLPKSLEVLLMQSELMQLRPFSTG